MLLREVALPRVGRVSLPMPKSTQILGLGVSRREEAPSLIVRAPRQEADQVQRTFVILSTAQSSELQDMSDIDQPQAQLLGVATGETASWAVYELVERDPDADVATALLAESSAG